MSGGRAVVTIPQAKNMEAKRKWHFTPQVDEAIRRIYLDGFRSNGAVGRLALRIGIPRWAIGRRAREIGAYQPRRKEPNWSERELAMLEHIAHLSPEAIKTRLALAGYRRTVTGIILKRKRMRYQANLKGMSATMVGECFGVDAHEVVRWIRGGWLKARRRGTARTPQQGGDMYFITERNLKRFIVACIGWLDHRKIDKFFLVDVLTAGAGALLRGELPETGRCDNTGDESDGNDEGDER